MNFPSTTNSILNNLPSAYPIQYPAASSVPSFLPTRPHSCTSPGPRSHREPLLHGRVIIVSACLRRQEGSRFCMGRANIASAWKGWEITGAFAECRARVGAYCRCGFGRAERPGVPDEKKSTVEMPGWVDVQAIAAVCCLGKCMAVQMCI